MGHPAIQNVDGITGAISAKLHDRRYFETNTPQFRQLAFDAKPTFNSDRVEHERFQKAPRTGLNRCAGVAPIGKEIVGMSGGQFGQFVPTAEHFDSGRNDICAGHSLAFQSLDVFR